MSEPELGNPRRQRRQTLPGTARKRFGEAKHRGTTTPQRTKLAKRPLRRRRRASDQALRKRKPDLTANNGAAVRERKMRHPQ